MHVLTDENGNVVHCHHTHTHTHTTEHSHEHVHEDGHGEDHSHSHECGKEHGHDCAQAGCGGCADAEKETLALVSYMLDHNRHHAMELDEMAKKLRGMGKEEAAVQIEKAVSDFESGNVRLGVALSLLKAE